MCTLRFFPSLILCHPFADDSLNYRLKLGVHFTTQQELPLPPAVKASLKNNEDEHHVLQSEVFLEIENKKGELITIQRTIKGTRDKNLITVIHGPALTTSDRSFTSTDFFVSRAGAATRELGFHRYLAEFLGWELPDVQTFDGNTVPLYLQCIFPYFVVEQMRGWSTIQPPLPGQFRIREPHKRAVEFLLDLDAHRNAVKRQELRLKKAQLESSWAAQARRLSALASSVNGVFQGLPRQPVSAWPPAIHPILMVRHQDTLIPIDQRVKDQTSRLRELQRSEIPRVADAAPALEGELASAESAVQERQALVNRLSDILNTETHELGQVERRITVLREDIQRNKDVKTLKALGSRRNSEVEADHCPVCHQDLSGALVQLSPEQEVMPIDENIEFLSEQLRTFQAMEASATKLVEARRQQMHATRDDLNRLRQRVRVLRKTLIEDDRAPSAAAVQERFELENILRQDEILSERVAVEFETFSNLAKDWRAVETGLAALPSADITDGDRAKLNQWGSAIRTQLGNYGFKSLSADQVDLSSDAYRPEYDGFDLQTSISASDLIRTIWSYLYGMLELSRDNHTQHPGCVLFDEPRQQSTRDVSFRALLEQASHAGKFDQQVIFFTSEDRQRLKLHLKGLPHTLREIDGRILKPLNPTE
ncbi:hypothetical protein PWR63_00700 [Paraburkholderia sp. A2WS-5]|uniref:hypothetical protein n=1 Tax=Paraburkholderia sp. A2WS-5 TaxID=3028372 RepID=UPI003B82AC96